MQSWHVIFTVVVSADRASHRLLHCTAVLYLQEGRFQDVLELCLESVRHMLREVIENGTDVKPSHGTQLINILSFHPLASLHASMPVLMIIIVC